MAFDAQYLLPLVKARTCGVPPSATDNELIAKLAAGLHTMSPLRQEIVGLLSEGESVEEIAYRLRKTKVNVQGAIYQTGLLLGGPEKARYKDTTLLRELIGLLVAAHQMKHSLPTTPRKGRVDKAAAGLFIREQIKVLMLQSRVSDRRLAKRVGMKPQVLQKILEGAEEPTVFELLEIAVALGVSVSELLGPHGTIEPTQTK
jgi:DNA-binding Xre family transcriptional regulator